MTDALQILAREVAETLTDPDRKQIRFNDIVRVAKRFYPDNPAAGVRELVRSCDREDHTLYVAKAPMWEVLETQYGWMQP